jgi:hypothetical protein
VAIITSGNPILNTSAGTATAPTFTYAGVTTAAMTLNGTIQANSGDYGVIVQGNNSHGGADVTTALTSRGPRW